MLKKILIIFLISYFLVLFQTSLLAHLPIFGNLPCLILILAAIFNLFEDSREKTGIFFALFCGFFLDFFSENFLGMWILILITISFFVKLIIKKYVRIPILKGT